MTAIHINIHNKHFPAVANTNSHQAISKLEFTLSSNEFVCLVGPSGCGKTTLLNLIAGLDTDYDGTIELGTANPAIGYVFQNPRLLPWRTVKENIALALPDHQNPDIINSLLEDMGLTSVADAYPERLSLGMSRRVAIIRAFAIDPNILLMDEPFVSLDPPTARQVRKLLINLWQQRPHNVLFVTHDLREAIALADRLIFLSSPPMCVVNEIKVDIARNERNNDANIESFRQHLIKNHPEINALL